MSEENKDDFPGEEEVIPANVLEIMAKYDDKEDTETERGKGDTETESTDTETVSETTETEVKETETESKDTETETSETEKETTETKAEDSETEPIPQEQINIARRLGWSDDYIVEVANSNPEILEDMVTLAGRQIQQPQVETKVEPAPKEKQEVKGVDKVELDAEALKKMKDSYGDEVVDSVILPLMGGLNKTIDQLNTLRGQVSGVEETNQANQAEKNFNEANTVFDGLTQTFTIFGKTDELPRLADGKYDVSSPAVQVRGEVFKVAMAFQTSGMSWTDSLKNAVRWYQGEHAEKSLERKIVKGLIDRKKKFSPRPTSKKTTQKFESREDEGVQLVRKAYKK